MAAWPPRGFTPAHQRHWKRKNNNMKAKTLKRVEILTAALLLTLLLGCGRSKPTEAENKEAFAEATAAAKASETPAAPAAPATPSTPATPAAEPTAAPTATAPTAAPAVAAPTSGTVRYDASPTGSKVRMDGSANIKSWSMETAIVGGFLEADAGFPETFSKVTAQVFMPVRSFKSGMGAMDGRMQKEMNEPQFKRIEYTLVELKPKSAAGATGPVAFDAVGALTVAGKTRTNAMPVTIERLTDGKLKVIGSTNLKMTDYGIEPPSTLGLFTSHDDLKISFEWLVTPKAQ
jgi:polyisoprenoid-binding protein YceI